VTSSRIYLAAALLTGALGCGDAASPPVAALPDGSFPATGGSVTCDADGDGVPALACGGLDCDDEHAAVHPGADEICGNAIDDDCDGLVDEDCGCTPGDLQACWQGTPETRGVGACTDGVRRCGADGSWGACTFAVGPSAESDACDGIDSDCDGVKDPPSCGACPPGAQEICGNGLDDDCDGVIDPPELCTASCDDVNPRAGDAGAMACCLRSPPAITEFQCHEGEGLDACADRACLDLDGSLDTRCSKLCDQTGCVCGRRQASGPIVAVSDCGFLSPCARLDCADRQDQPCYSGPPSTLGVGLCHAGSHSCTTAGDRRQWGACTGEVGPAPEICGNGLDDDCDGSIDEEDGATGRRCAPASDCGPAAIEVCGNGLDDDCDGFADEGCAASAGRQACWTGPLAARGTGACKDGAQMDENGAWGPCTGEVLPAPEICGDGIDSDCNGLGGPKDPEEPACCVPQAEVCNGRDDDCDGEVDEGLRNRCGQCPGTGSCYGAAFDDAGDCTRTGRTCVGVEPSAFDPSLITLPGGEGTTGATDGLVWATQTISSPYDVQAIGIDPESGKVVRTLHFGTYYLGEVAPAADGTLWMRKFYSVEHYTSDGTLLCKSEGGTDFAVGLALEPGGDVWALFSPTGSNYVRRISGTDVQAEKSPGVPWPDGVPRCTTIDLDPDTDGTDLVTGDFGAITLDARGRLWSLTTHPLVWDAGTVTHLSAVSTVFTLPVLAPDGSLLVGWPMRRIDPDAWLAGDPDAIQPVGNYGFNISATQGLPDGTVVGFYNEYQKPARVVHVDPRSGAVLGDFTLPETDAAFVLDNLAVDSAGHAWVGIGSEALRVDLADGHVDAFEPGGDPNFGTHATSSGSVFAPVQGSWTQDVDAGSYDVAWGQLSFEANAENGDTATVSVRFADRAGDLAASTVVCGPYRESPADLAACSKGLRHARIVIRLAGTGRPVAGHIRLTWDRP
jgi:hypothetical protein